MKKLFLAVSVMGLSMGLSACATTDNTVTDTPAAEAQAVAATKVVNLAGMTNDVATEALYQGLIHANYLATKVTPTKIAVQFGDNQFLLEPSLNPEGIDRILMNRFYAVHPQLQASQELPGVIGELNKKLSFAKFILIEQGAVIQVQGTVTFANRVEIEELRRFMLWTDGGLSQVASTLPEGAEQFIRPIPLMQALPSVQVEPQA